MSDTDIDLPATPEAARAWVIDTLFQHHVEHTYDLGGKPFEDYARSGALDDMRAEFEDKFAHVRIDFTPSPEPSIALPAAAPADDEEEEERRRGARGMGDASLSPTHAQLGANIRPDVVSGPAGLEVITTQKSADYRPDLAARDYVEAELSAADEERPSRR